MEAQIYVIYVGVLSRYLETIILFSSDKFSRSVCVWLFATPWTAARQASLSISNSRSLLKLVSIELVMPSNHLILCCPLLLLPSSFSASGSFPMSLLFTWDGQKYQSFSFGISLSNEYSGFLQCSAIGFPLELTSLQSKGLSRVFSNTTVQRHQLFNDQPSLWSNSCFGGIQVLCHEKT